MIAEEQIKLTQFSHGSGCGCKIAPGVLEEILKSSGTQPSFKDLLVGYESKDDAAVYRLGNGTCLVSTTDFFYTYCRRCLHLRTRRRGQRPQRYLCHGREAASGCSYPGLARRKTPAIACIQGPGRRQGSLRRSKHSLGGGHSIDSPEPFFGLAVSGLVNEHQILRNNTAKEGDLLFLTKPIGTGILSSAMKRGKIQPGHEDVLVRNLVSINTIGAELAGIEGVHAVTDITGFGLAGHLVEMAEGSSLTAEIDMKKVPLLEGAASYAAQFIFPDNTYRNWNAYEKKVTGVTGPSSSRSCDPQTNGGLFYRRRKTPFPPCRSCSHALFPACRPCPLAAWLRQASFAVQVSE
jgi:selenide,water dikinase